MGTTTPLLGMFSAMLGPFSSTGGAALSVASSIMQDVSANGLVSSIAPVVDKRFSEYSTITAFVGDYLEASVMGIEGAYNSIIGNGSSADSWAGSPYAPSNMRNGNSGDGFWVNSDFTLDLSTNLLQKMIRIFTYKAIK